MILLKVKLFILAFGRHGDLETSFSIVDEMSSKQIPLTSVTFNFLLQASASDKEAGFRHALIVSINFNINVLKFYLS